MYVTVLRIAVCDDEKETANRHARMAEACLRECKSVGEVSTYTRSENLLYDITEDGMHYDLLLLDIEMPGINGMELAEKVRLFLPRVKMIFITSHIEYAVDAFELNIFRYVPKGELTKRLPAAIKDAVELLGLEEGSFYTIQTNSRLERIPCREICYIERDGKNARIVTFRGASRVRKSLQQVFEELAAEEFLYIDRGCIVNLIHILQIKDGMAVLENEITLPISRSHLKQVKERINTYWGMHI